MDDQKRTLMAKDLAESFQTATAGDTAHEAKVQAQGHPQGFLGNILQGSFATSLWQMVATKLIAIVEEVVRENIDAFLVKHGGATGGLYAAGQEPAQLNVNQAPTNKP